MQSPGFEIEVLEDGGARRFEVRGEDPAGARVARQYRLAGPGQQDYLDLHQGLARDFGTRMPRNRNEVMAGDGGAAWQPLLTRNISPYILYGYGDPAVLRAGEDYYLFVTSNDAPNAFPILRSPDLQAWTHVGFAFPEGGTPAWAATGPSASDYWAPEVHAVGGNYLLCFSARDEAGALAIGLALANSPEGPFEPAEKPLLEGGVIDAHIFVDEDGSPTLFWKEDRNDAWPGLVASLLRERADAAARLFAAEEDIRTAALSAALWPWMSALQPMERFFALQPLIEAGSGNFIAVREGLARLGGETALAALAAMETPIFAQRLSPDGLRLEGERRAVLVNDLEWEGHLIEGPWVTRRQGRYYLFYSGNDFSTADYGIGVAVADSLPGPYRKMAGPLLRSNSAWTGPGHPSVAAGPDGEERIFFHAFRPGRAGYKEFRALLTARLEFTPEGVRLRP